VRVADITAGSGCADPGPSSRSSARSPARSLPTPVVDSSPGCGGGLDMNGCHGQILGKNRKIWESPLKMEVCMKITYQTAMPNYQMGLSFYFNGVLRLESWELL
jgi:hypothetical protein